MLRHGGAIRPKSNCTRATLFRTCPFGQSTVTKDLAFLEKRTVPTKSEGSRVFHSESASPKFDSEGFFYFLGRARFAHGIILTHDCEFDKDRRGLRAQVARLGAVDDLKPDERTQVMNQGSYSKMVLPNVPTLGSTLYVDFRTQITLDTRLINSKRKIASLSEFGRQRLRVGLIYYFLRKEPPDEFVQ
jgi:hypothetical protein